MKFKKTVIDIEKKVLGIIHKINKKLGAKQLYQLNRRGGNMLIKVPRKADIDFIMKASWKGEKNKNV